MAKIVETETLITRVRKGFRDLIRKTQYFTRFPWATYGEAPPITMETLMMIRQRDPNADLTITYLAGKTAGIGYHVSCISEEDFLKKKVEGLEYEDVLHALDAVQDYDEDMAMDEKLLQTADEDWATGNSFWKQASDYDKTKNLEILPIESIKDIQRIKKEITIAGKTKKVTLPIPQHYKQTRSYGGFEIPAKEVLHFRWNPINNAAFGVGILNALAETISWLDPATKKRVTRPPLYEIRARMLNDTAHILHRYIPKLLWKRPGLEGKEESEWNAFVSLIKELPWDVDYGTTDKDFDVKSINISPQRGFIELIEFVDREYITALKTPVIKLLTTPGYTEASAKEATAAGDQLVAPMQRFIKRRVEKLVWAPIIKEGYGDFEGLKDNWKHAQIRLNWGLEEKPEITFEAFVGLLNVATRPQAPSLPGMGFEPTPAFAQQNEAIMRIEEIRKNLQKMGIELWEPKAPEEGAEATAQVRKFRKPAKAPRKLEQQYAQELAPILTTYVQELKDKTPDAKEAAVEKATPIIRNFTLKVIAAGREKAGEETGEVIPTSPTDIARANEMIQWQIQEFERQLDKIREDLIQKGEL